MDDYDPDEGQSMSWYEWKELILKILFVLYIYLVATHCDPQSCPPAGW